VFEAVRQAASNGSAGIIWRRRYESPPLQRTKRSASHHAKLV
jgi:hypothetical protein